MRQKRPLQFLCVENRTNATIKLCKRAAMQAGVSFDIVSAESSSQERYQRFLAAYQHFSPNDPSFEKACFRRYFLLLDYFIEHSTEECVLIDSDVLLFEGIEDHIKSLAYGNDFLGSRIVTPERIERQISPHVSYWTKASLNDFLDFIVNFYALPDDGFTLTREYLRKYQLDLGISDMTLLYLWDRERGATPPINSIRAGNVVDHNVSFHLNVGEIYFLRKLGSKLIDFSQGYPQFVTSNGEKIRAVAIHCQGRAKLNMKNILDANLIRITATSFAVLVGKILKRLLRRFRLYLRWTHDN